MLDRDAAMRLRVAHRADDAGLRIGPARSWGCRAASRSGEDWPSHAATSCGADAPPVGERGDGARRRTRTPSHLDRREHASAAGARDAPSSTRRSTRFSTMKPSGWSPTSAMVVMQEERAICPSATRISRIGSASAARSRHRPSAANTCARAPGERGGAAVERLVEAALGRLAIDERGLDARARGGERQAHAREPAAHHQKLDADVRHAPRIAGRAGGTKRRGGLGRPGSRTTEEGAGYSPSAPIA